MIIFGIVSNEYEKYTNNYKPTSMDTKLSFLMYNFNDNNFYLNNNAIEYIEAAINKGLDVEQFSNRISFFFNSHNYFLQLYFLKKENQVLH